MKLTKIKYFRFILLLSIASKSSCQEIFITENESEADFIIYVSDDKSKADWIVIKTNWRNDAKDGK